MMLDTLASSNKKGENLKFKHNVSERILQKSVVS